MYGKLVKRSLVLALLAALVATPSTAWANVFKLKANLVATELDPFASGQANWEFDTSNGRMKLSVQGEDITLGESVFVFVNWRFMGEFPIVNGSFDLNLDTQDGDLVPRVKKGQNVSILSNGCWLVLEGTFEIDR